MLSSLAESLDTAPATDKTLLTINRRGPEALQSLLRQAFDAQPITLEERTLPGADDDVVVLISEGRVIATSPMSQLRDTFLLVNTDHYRTSANRIEEGAVPDVLTNLTDVEFTVRGFPVSNKEKLLLVAISRCIEARALAAAEGTYRVGFQSLSRLDDEYGTRTVHELLAETALDMHVYGARTRGQSVADELPVTTHTGDSDELRQSWFVVFEPANGDSEAIALVAIKVGSNEWRSLWTEDTARVRAISEYVAETFD